MSHDVPSSSPVLTEEHYQQLLNEVRILQLINHRNKNQHRLLTWWKYFRLLLSHLKQIVLWHLPSHRSLQQQAIEKLFKKKIFNKCYYEFNGIIVLSQFLLLGLSLVSSLSKVYEILVGYKPQSKSYDRNIIDEVDEELGEEIEYPQSFDTRQAVESNSETNHLNPPTSVEPESSDTTKKRKFDDKDDKKKKKKKSKKKKTDIDLLFA